jgi:hypothetical protein
MWCRLISSLKLFTDFILAGLSSETYSNTLPAIRRWYDERVQSARLWQQISGLADALRCYGSVLFQVSQAVRKGHAFLTPSENDQFPPIKSRSNDRREHLAPVQNC